MTGIIHDIMDAEEVYNTITNTISNESTDKKELPRISSATLLSVEEAEKYLSRSERKYNIWWWLRSPGYSTINATNFDPDGDLSYIGYFVNCNNFCVRPALIINLKDSDFNIGDVFKINSYEFKIISDTLAWLYKQDIGQYPFNKNKEDGNDYNTSYIKKVVDYWFNTKILSLTTTDSGVKMMTEELLAEISLLRQENEKLKHKEELKHEIDEIKYGKWLPCAKNGWVLDDFLLEAGEKWYGYRCSNCGFIYKGNALIECNFCQSCGAKMLND